MMSKSVERWIAVVRKKSILTIDDLDTIGKVIKMLEFFLQTQKLDVSKFEITTMIRNLRRIAGEKKCG